MSAVWMAAGAVLLAVTQTGAPAQDVVADARFAPVREPLPTAVTYDTKAVPEGGRVRLAEDPGRRTTRLTLRVEGLKPDRVYGAHVHTKPCGAKPDASGPHYQHRADPQGATSGDPRYANPANEVWLDFTTDRRGTGEAEAFQWWRFREGEARSLVLHEHGTAVDPGHAGTAGARVACVTVTLK